MTSKVSKVAELPGGPGCWPGPRLGDDHQQRRGEPQDVLQGQPKVIRIIFNFPSRVFSFKVEKSFVFPCSCCGKEWRLLCNEGEGDCDSDDQVEEDILFTKS